LCVEGGIVTSAARLNHPSSRDSVRRRIYEVRQREKPEPEPTPEPTPTPEPEPEPPPEPT